MENADYKKAESFLENAMYSKCFVLNCKINNSVYILTICFIRIYSDICVNSHKYDINIIVTVSY